jgi:hypothetical protein
MSKGHRESDASERRRVLRTRIATAGSSASRTQTPWMDLKGNDDLETLSIRTP